MIRWRYEKKSGILAGAAIYALDNMVDRLAEDHKHAKLFKPLGGGMKQSRIQAETAMHALNNIVDRLADDHKT